MCRLRPRPTQALHDAPGLGQAVAELRRILLASQAARAPLHLDTKLLNRFLEWSRDERHNSPGHVRDQRRYLTAWTQALRGVDLRELSVREHVLPKLRKLSARTHRIRALKRLVSWLANVEHELERDPLSTLKVPQSRPAQWSKSKVVDLEDLARTTSCLSRRWRDAIEVLAGTAWHVTELQRFSRSGEVLEPTPLERARGVAGVLATRHKSGQPFLIPVSQAVLEAARRQLGHGLSIARLHKALSTAARAAGVVRWTPGRLRHTVATYALAQGALPAAVSAFLHQSSDYRTVRRWYAVYVAPAKIPTIR